MKVRWLKMVRAKIIKCNLLHGEGDILLRVGGVPLYAFTSSPGNFKNLICEKEYEIKLRVLDFYSEIVDIQEKLIKLIWKPPKVNKYLIIGKLVNKIIKEDKVIYSIDCGIPIEMVQKRDSEKGNWEIGSYVLLIGRIDIFLKK